MGVLQEKLRHRKKDEVKDKSESLESNSGEEQEGLNRSLVGSWEVAVEVQLRPEDLQKS